jgi:hypothetical protein
MIFTSNSLHGKCTGGDKYDLGPVCLGFRPASAPQKLEAQTNSQLWWQAFGPGEADGRCRYIGSSEEPKNLLRVSFLRNYDVCHRQSE